jgi:Na+-transporting NADH:ubiquinone oxidoreductase subunit C
MTVLSLVCAIILSTLASILQVPKEVAKDLDRSKQMLLAAKILDYQGRFLIQNDKGEYVVGKYLKDGVIVPGSEGDYATNAQILEVYQKRLIPMLTDKNGDEITFQKAGIDLNDYVTDFKKSGYYKQPYKLFYKILSNPSQDGKIDDKPIGYVIPINGFGLWDAIYGYLAIKTDGNTVIGISWYDQKETPGLGANISEEPWQSLFPDKQIFMASPDGKIDYKTAPLGIVVVKGKVSEVLGDAPKAKSAVDGMAGATLTGNGVTDAYRDVLNAYRPLLIKINSAQQKS